MKRKGSGIYISISDKIARIYIMDLWLEECVWLKKYIFNKCVKIGQNL